jgi:hypothetical protein
MSRKLFKNFVQATATTDGVGTLSKEFESQRLRPIKQMVRRWWLKERFPFVQLPFVQLPFAQLPFIQILSMGSKGMVIVDHTLSGLVICLRPSTVKFLIPEAVQDIEISRTPTMSP